MEERLDHRSKLRLMSQFMFGVGGYIVARIAAILLPLFFVNQPGQEDLAIRIVLILENVVLWAFLAALAYIFRWAEAAVWFCCCVIRCQMPLMAKQTLRNMITASVSAGLLVVCCLLWNSCCKRMATDTDCLSLANVYLKKGGNDEC